jgi:ubiquinone/menaquinone biosynthesis C-methylase UbiE
MRGTDQTFLLERQYNDASKLGARMELHRRFSTNPRDLYLWMFEQLDLPREARVLELGCGPGDLWLRNLHRIPSGWDVALTDFSAGMLGEAERNLSESGRRFRFAVADAQDIPYGDAGFDAVVANFMLYHAPDRPRAFSEIARVLRPGGSLYAMTTGRGHLREIRIVTETLAPPAEGRAAPLPDGGAFDLENGARQLAPWFGEVELRRFEDSLLITEAEPLVAYILSSNRAHEILGGLPAGEADRRVSDLTAALGRELAERGAIRIAKDPGLFIARRGERT